MKPAGWKGWLDSPGSRQMKVLGDFFRSLDWWTLVPDPLVIAGDAGERAAARSSNRDWAVVYLPAAGSVTVAMDAVEAIWLNPATGERRPAPGTPTFTAPESWPDAVLFLRAR